jgi:hypothetical protein
MDRVEPFADATVAGSGISRNSCLPQAAAVYEKLHADVTSLGGWLGIVKRTRGT